MGIAQPIIPPDIRGGDIIQIHSPFAYHQRAVLLRGIGGKDDTLTLLPIHYWGDNVMGFLQSKEYLHEGMPRRSMNIQFKCFLSLGSELKKSRSKKQIIPIKIGEKFELKHEGNKHRATVVGIAHGHYIFVMDAPVGKELGGYAMYLGRESAIESLGLGEIKHVKEWNFKSPGRKGGIIVSMMGITSIITILVLKAAPSLSTALVLLEHTQVILISQVVYH